MEGKISIRFQIQAQDAHSAINLFTFNFSPLGFISAAHKNNNPPNTNFHSPSRFSTHRKSLPHRPRRLPYSRAVSSSHSPALRCLCAPSPSPATTVSHPSSAHRASPPFSRSLHFHPSTSRSGRQNVLPSLFLARQTIPPSAPSASTQISRPFPPRKNKSARPSHAHE